MTGLDKLSKGMRAYILLFLLTFFTALPGIFTMPALDRDESRFAQASKQMLETGDYIRIREQDGLRNKKPAGIHWLQAGSTALLSSAEAKQIWSYRVPSLLGAALASCAVFWAGIPLIGRRAAFIGAALFGTGVLIIFETNMSKTDAVLVAITTLGVGALIHLRNWLYRPKSMAFLFWFAMGFGFLIKGPVTPMVAFLAVIFASLWARHGFTKWPMILSLGLIFIFLDNYFDFGSADKFIGSGMKAVGVIALIASGVRFVLDERKEAWFRHLFWWPGPVLWVAMVLPWFLWIQSATDGAFFQGAVGKDLKDKVVGASEGHGGPPGYHTLFLLFMFMPATLFLIPAISQAVRRVRSGLAVDKGLFFLIAWFIPTWIVFEFLPTKLPHYLLPAYPALALMCGYAAVKLADGARMEVSRWLSLLVFLTGALVLGVVTSPIGTNILQAEALGDFKTVDPEVVKASWAAGNPQLWVLIPFFILVGLASVTFIMRRYQMAVLLAVLSISALSIHGRVIFFPQQHWALATEAARNALADICGLPDQAGCEVHPSLIQAYGYAEPSFVFTTGTDVKISPQSSLELLPASQVPVAVWVLNLESRIVSEDDITTLRNQARQQQRCFTMSEPHYAANYSNGDPSHFIAIRIDAGPCPAP